MRIARALMLVVPLYAASVVVFPDATPAAYAKAKKAKHGKKSKKAEAAPEVASDGMPAGDAPAKPRKVTAAAIVKWSKKGVPDAEIMGRVEAASFIATKKDIKLFQKKKLSPELIASLGGPSTGASKRGVEVASADEAAPPAKKVDLTKAASVRDIDFDAVPPPPGSPEAERAKQAPAPAAEPAKLDRSTRPSMPLEEDKSAAAAQPASGAPRVRKPIVPSD